MFISFEMCDRLNEWKFCKQSVGLALCAFSKWVRVGYFVSWFDGNIKIGMGGFENIS